LPGLDQTSSTEGHGDAFDPERSSAGVYVAVAKPT
jgi:hypothetical protein